MASIGLRKPYYAHYSYDEPNDTVTYSGGGLLAKAVEFSASIETPDSNNLYADDGVAETDASFSGGSLSITTDDLTQQASAAILGATLNTLTVGTESVSELVFDDDVSRPFLGFGVIIPKVKNGVSLFRAIVFPKVAMKVSEDAATTRGETIEWQTPKLEGSIFRSDAGKHP